MSADEEIVGNQAAADYIGVSVNTWRPYVARDKHRTGLLTPHRREIQGGHAVPVWWRSTLDAWMATRPGQGVGGGRKPKRDG